MLSFVIVLLHFVTVSNTLWIQPKPSKIVAKDLIEDISNLQKDLKYLGLNLPSEDEEKRTQQCEIKLYNEPHFNGDNYGVTKQRERFLYGSIALKLKSYERSIGFADVESLQVIGPCCWIIYRYVHKEVLNLSKLVQINPNLSKLVQTCQNLFKLVQFSNLSNLV